MHIVSQLLPLYVCQSSSKSNNFQRKKAGEEKSSQSKKHNFHEMLDLLSFYSKTIESSGILEVETFFVV